MAQLEGSSPIRIGGETTGTVTVTRDGLMTVFSAACRDDGELIRLSVFDAAGNAGYLGVMLPENGRLTLTKRFSRAGMEAFPEEIVCAGVVWEAEGEANAGDAVSQEQVVAEAEDEESADLLLPEETAAAADLVWKLQPNPWSLFAEPEMKAALCSVRGALTATESGSVLLAIPVSMDGIGLSDAILELGELRTIDETEYVVFRL